MAIEYAFGCRAAAQSGTSSLNRPHRAGDGFVAIASFRFFETHVAGALLLVPDLTKSLIRRCLCLSAGFIVPEGWQSREKYGIRSVEYLNSGHRRGNR